MSATGSVPAHVPAHLVADVDIYALPLLEGDAQLAWYTLQQAHPPIFWTPYHGGHWIATRGAAIKAIQQDAKSFSQRSNIIPPTPMNMIPMNLDPPQQAPYRAIIQPAFAAARVKAMERQARELAVELINTLVPQRHCEFVSAFATKLPVLVFLKMMDLPEEDREYLKTVCEPLAEGDATKTTALLQELKNYLGGWLAKRRREPGDDMISRIVHAKVHERPLTDAEIEAMCLLLLLGGLDTVVALMSFIARFLAYHPAHCRQLVAEPGLIPNAIDEFIRRHGIVNTARQVTHDLEFDGVRFREGDMVCIPNCLYGLDELIFPDPLTVDFHRRPATQAAFGTGPHFCPGAALTKSELQVFLEEWLVRIPVFTVAPGTVPLSLTGNLNTMKRLHLTW